jgi:hypothetical protein
METKLNSILENTLKKVDGLKPAILGKTEILSGSKEAKKELLYQLKDESKFINRFIIAIIILHFLLFALAVFLVLYYRDSPNVIVLLLGGSVLSLIAIITSLIRLLNTKSKIVYMLVTLPNLSPEQAMIVVQSIYFEGK